MNLTTVLIRTIQYTDSNTAINWLLSFAITNNQIKNIPHVVLLIIFGGAILF